MRFSKLVPVLFFVSFIRHVKLISAGKIVLGNPDPRSFLPFRKNVLNTQSQKSCDCSAMISCSCCEVVKIFYTSEEKHLCFNMTYRNGLNFDLSLDSLIIKTMTVSNYKPFYMCSFIPGLLFTTICVHILEINQFARSITICPRLEVASKKERWQIGYGCASVAVSSPPAVMPMQMGQPQPAGPSMPGQMGPPTMSAMPTGMQASSPAAMNAFMPAGSMPMMPGPTPASPMTNAPTMAQMPSAPATPGMPNMPATMQMPSMMPMPMMPGAQAMGQMPMMPGAPAMGQMPATMQTPTMMPMPMMPGAPAMGQMPPATMPPSQPPNPPMMQAPNAPQMLQALGASTVLQIPVIGNMSAMKLENAQIPGILMLGQMPAASMVQIPATVMTGQMPAMPVTTPKAMSMEQMSGAAGMENKPKSSAMVQVTGTALMGQVPGMRINNQMPTASLIQQNPMDLSLSDTSTLNKLSDMMKQILNIPGIDQMFGAVAASEISDTSLGGQISFATAASKMTDTSTVKQMSMQPTIEDLEASATTMLKTETTEKSHFPKLEQNFNYDSVVKSVTEHIIPLTEKESSKLKLNETMINMLNQKLIEQKLNNASPKNSTTSNDGYMSDNILLHLIDKLNSKSKNKTNVTFINSQKLIEQLSQIFTPTDNEQKLVTNDITTPSITNRQDLRVLTRPRRNYDIFDLLHQSNRCEQAYRICVTKSKNIVISRLINSRNTRRRNTCLNKPGRIVFERPDDMCIVNNNYNDQLQITTPTPKATIPIPQSDSLPISQDTQSDNIQTSHASQTDNSLGAIIIHDETFEGSDFHPQNTPHINPVVAKRPDIFPQRTPPLIAQQLAEQLFKNRMIFNDTIIIRDSSEN